MFRLEIYKGGFRKFCTVCNGFPVTLKFAPVMSREEPALFESREDALEAWLLFQKARPADTTGWYEEVVEVNE